MTTLKIEPTQIRSFARALRTVYTGPHREAMGHLAGLQNALRGAWSAQAQVALDGAFGNWLSRFDQRAQDLLAGAAYLERTADGYEALERRLATGQPQDLVGGRGGGAGKSMQRPMPQGSGPSVGGPVATSGGSLAQQTFNGTAKGTGEFPLTNVQLHYSADYSIEYWQDRVVVRLTQYPSTLQINTPTHWSSAATIITRSGRQIQVVIDPLDPQSIARPEDATLTLPVDPNDPPVRMDLYIVNVADGPAGAFPSRQYYSSVALNVPPPAPTPTVTGPYVPTPTPNPVPGLNGPKPIVVPTPTPQPGTTTPTPAPTPSRPVTPPRHGGPAIPQ